MLQKKKKMALKSRYDVEPGDLFFFPSHTGLWRRMLTCISADVTNMNEWQHPHCTVVTTNMIEHEYSKDVYEMHGYNVWHEWEE